MIRVSRAVFVCFLLCVSVCCLSLFHMEGEQIRQGDNEMERQQQPLQVNPVDTFSRHGGDNRAGAAHKWRDAECVAFGGKTL